MLATHRNNPWFYAFLIVTIGMIANAVFHGCNRKPDITTEPTTKQQALTGKIDTHAIRSAIERQYRDSLDAITKPIQDRQIKERIVYRYIKIQDEQLERDYNEGKATADSVISSKNKRIAKGETLLARCDSLRGQDSLKIASQAGTLMRQDTTLSEVGKIGQDALAENAVLQKKLKRRNRLIAIGAGAIALFVGGVVANR